MRNLYSSTIALVDVVPVERVLCTPANARHSLASRAYCIPSYVITKQKRLIWL